MKSNTYTNSSEPKLTKKTIMSGDVGTVERALRSDESLPCLFGIFSCVKNHIVTPAVSDLLRKLKERRVHEFCMYIDECAMAALDVLGVEKYTGDNRNVLKLIENNFDFMYD